MKSQRRQLENRTLVNSMAIISSTRGSAIKQYLSTGKKKASHLKINLDAKYTIKTKTKPN